MFKKPVEEVPVVKCSCCPAAASSGSGVWGHPVCDACFGRWHDEAPNAGEAERLSTPAQLSASKAAGGLVSAFYEAWTAAWVKRNARSVAA